MCFDDGVDRMHLLRGLSRCRIVVIAESVASMKPGCVLICPKQGLVRARIHWDIRAAKFHRIECVARRLLHINVAGNNRDRGYANIRRAQSHDERNRVVRRCVRIDEKGARHAR